jgi:predicted amino acid racemase
MQTRACADRWQVAVLPVLKGIASHPPALRELALAGFSRFGYAEYAEALRNEAGGGRSSPAQDSPVLIQICPLSQVREVARLFGRSFHSTPESLFAMDQAAAETGGRHSVLLMLDLGEQREGIPLPELPQFLDYARSLSRLSVDGFAFTLGCSGKCMPDAALLQTIKDIRAAFQSRALSDVAVSAGGSVFCRWLEDFGAGFVTEVRLGANFILGTDTYRKLPLPGGPFRSDVCFLQGEVLELSQRVFRKDKTGPLPELDGYPTIAAPVSGKRLCALLDIGRIHIKLEELACALPGAVIAGISSKYLELDVTDCPVLPRVGQHVLFRLGYWSIAKSFHSFLVPLVTVRDDWPELSAIRRGEFS